MITRVAWGILLVGLTTVLMGCGDDAQETEGDASRVVSIETERPQLAFVDGVDLAISDDRGGNARTLTGESVPGSVIPALFTRVSWAPDGSRIAFAGSERRETEEVGERERAEPTDIYLIDADGADTQRVTEVGDALDPQWSPDGETIVFTRTTFGPGEPLRGDLWSVATDGSGLSQLTTVEAWQTDQAGSFSPDGSELAFTRRVLDPETGAEASAVFVMGADGSDERLLLERAAHPAYSPDGTQLAFVSDRDQHGQLCYGDRCFFAAELYVGSADGSEAERLTTTDALNEAAPSWLRDGSRIAYQRGEQVDNAEGMSIAVTNADGTCAQVIMGGGALSHKSPVWRPTAPRAGNGVLTC
jgi:Tol biopolymer transport system component